MRIVKIKIPCMLVAINGVSIVAIPAGDWRSASKVDKGRGWMEIRGINGVLEVALGFQTAQVDDTPSDHTGAGDLFVGFQTTNGVKQSEGVKTISAATDTKKLMRPCIYVKLTSGSTLATAAVCGEIELFIG